MERPFERVYTVNDFYDRPRAGFADLDGLPHAYRSIWREDLDDWDPQDRYELSPVSAELLSLALEDWAIWQRWKDAFHSGRITDVSHPALPGDRDRHAELAPVIERALEIDPMQRQVAVGEFRALGDGRNARGMFAIRTPLEVRWRPVE